MRRAVFLDRDGTLIIDRHYLGDPEGVTLLPGAAAGLRRLNEAGIAAVLVTNQSGIGRGYFGEAEYRAVHARLLDVLAGEGARLDAEYHCALAPGAPDPDRLRKPGPGMFLRAAADLGLDLTSSWFVGDRLRDVTPARELGASAVMIRGPESDDPAEADWPALAVAASLDEAVSYILDRIH